jgi:tetratricopeptide (TPR) repeat protein
LNAGRLEAGLALIDKAAVAVPADPIFGRPADWLSEAAGRKRRAAGWEAGIAYADRGMKLLSEDKSAVLRWWRGSAYRQWSQEHLAKGDFDGSLKVLAAGLDVTSKDRDLTDGLDYHVHKALKVLHAKDSEAAAAHFTAVSKQFPTNDVVKHAGVGFVRNRMIELAEAKKFAESVDFAKAGKPFAGDAAPEITAEAFDRWAHHLAKRKEWEPAIAKYAEGLKAVPGNDRLMNNAVVTVLDWAKTEKNNSAEAVRVVELGLKYLPKNERLEEARVAYRDRPRK